LRQLESERVDGGKALRLFRVGLFGYSHMYGGYPGGQAEYARVPFADIGPLKVPDTLTDEQVLFLSDIFPTGYMAADNCQIKPGDTVAVWGAARSASSRSRARTCSAPSASSRSIASPNGSSSRPHRAARDAELRGVDVLDALRHMTGGQGPTRASTRSVSRPRHDARRVVRPRQDVDVLATDRPHALRQAISACRKGGTVSIPGVYGGWLDKFPLGAAFAKGLTLKMGQTHMHKYMPILLERIERGEIDPVVHHHASHRLEDAPAMYRTFRDKHDSCIKVVITPACTLHTDATAYG
jgi:threonine dehydrogenase-like Zn-dependent dehydrogenase